MVTSTITSISKMSQDLAQIPIIGLNIIVVRQVRELVSRARCQHMIWLSTRSPQVLALPRRVVAEHRRLRLPRRLHLQFRLPLQVIREAAVEPLRNGDNVEELGGPEELRALLDSLALITMRIIRSACKWVR
jgi:hypothetical protein